jgi:predicted lipid-binding transport protein (Tim44 family)
MARRFLVGGAFGALFLGRPFGGFGLLELLVLTGLILLAFRALSGSRETLTASYAGFYGGAPSALSTGPPPDVAAGALEHAVAQIRETDPSFAPARFAEIVTETFRRVQEAWTARDMRPAADALTVELREQLQRECDRLRSSGKVNRVERMTVRRAAIIDARRERGWDQVTVHIVATLVDYTTDEGGRKVLAGNPFEPVRFEERWNFIRPTGSTPWRVSAMH